MELKVPKEIQEPKGLKEPKVILELKEQLEPRGQEVILERKVQQVTMELKGK